MRVTFLSLVVIGALAASTGPAAAGVGKGIQVTHNCVGGVSCVTREGSQSGLTMIEATGALPAEAGNFVPLHIINRDTGQTLEERKVGIAANGSFAVGIPAYKFPPGNYVFAVRDRNGGKTGVGGYFAIADAGDPRPEAPQPSSAYRPPEAYQTGRADEPEAAPSEGKGFFKSFVEGFKQGLRESAESGSATPRDAAGSGSGGSGGGLFLGTWYGANVMAQITIHPDGTYTSPNGGRGTWQASGRSIHFTGALAAWNGGNATLSDKNAIEFKWQTPQLGKQYFALIRR